MDKLMSVEKNQDDVVIRIPIDLLLYAQSHREEPYEITDVDAMIETMKEYLLTKSNYGEYSDFELFLDEFFSWAYGNCETWISSPLFDEE